MIHDFLATREGGYGTALVQAIILFGYILAQSWDSAIIAFVVTMI